MFIGICTKFFKQSIYFNKNNVLLNSTNVYNILKKIKGYIQKNRMLFHKCTLIENIKILPKLIARIESDFHFYLSL